MDGRIEHYARQKREDLVEQLARGVVTDYPLYREFVGRIAQVDEFIAEIEDIRRRDLAGDEDED